MLPYEIPTELLAPDVATTFNALRQLVHTLHTASRESERKLGVTGAQLFVLTQLGATPSLSINALAERTMTHQSTVSVVVRRLVRRKLVKKVRAASDARRVELTLTTAGWSIARRAPEAMQIRLARAIDELSTADRRAFGRSLVALLGSLGVADAPAAMLFEDPKGK